MAPLLNMLPSRSVALWIIFNWLNILQEIIFVVVAYLDARDSILWVLDK